MKEKEEETPLFLRGWDCCLDEIILFLRELILPHFTFLCIFVSLHCCKQMRVFFPVISQGASSDGKEIRVSSFVDGVMLLLWSTRLSLPTPRLFC